MKRISIISLICLGLLVSLISPVYGQSLEVRRAQKAFTEDVLPKVTEKLTESLGFAVPLEFDFESINGAKDPVWIYESLPGGALYYIGVALTEVGVDDLGKQALQEKVSKIRFVHNDDPEVAGVSMDEEGVVTLTMVGTSATSEIAYAELKEFLEENL